MIFILVSLFLLIPYVWLMLYYRRAWKAIPGFQIIENANHQIPFISIIIAARNEEKNIGKCIQSIIDQSYATDKFEIIITDDHSTDQTVSVKIGRAHV